MQEVVTFVLNTDRRPAETETNSLPPGPIYRSPKVIKAERERPVDDLTNNHLIRQRLTILSRLVDDILANYCDNDASRVTDIIVEVARDLQDYSGITAKEMAGELTKRLSHFTSAVKYLKKHAPDLTLTGSLIRKCRIAMDLDWRCPFTGKKYDAYELPQLEREHIIPYSERPTNALDSLVLTYDWINHLKGKRTTLQFIKDVSDDERFFSPGNYGKFVEKLKVSKRETYPDNMKTKKALSGKPCWTVNLLDYHRSGLFLYDHTPAIGLLVVKATLLCAWFLFHIIPIRNYLNQFQF